MKRMDLSLGTILIQIVNFIIFIVIVAKLFLRPIKKVLDQREAQIKKDINDAEALKASATNLMEEYERKIGIAKAEAQDIVKNAIASGEMMKNDIINEAKAEARRERERAEEELRISREKAEKALRAQIADLAVSVASKVLKETLDQESQERLIKEFVRKVESQNAL